MIVPIRIAPSVRPSRRTPEEVLRAFRARLAAGARLLPVGTARRDPLRLLSSGYAPRHEVSLFGTTFYLAELRQNDDVRFFVAYVVPPAASGPAAIHPRLLYKDLSLVWRAASHLQRSPEGIWIGKGDVKTGVEDGEEITYSDEATTNLPLEMQTALETLARRARQIPHDERAVDRVLRRAPLGRIEAYRDFTEPRRRAQADRRNLVNGGRPVARFRRKGDPASLVFAPGFAPDFARGIVEVARATSRMYGGALRRYRILARNRRAQYLFIAGPRQVWIPAVQATTTELSSYGVRTVDVAVDEDLLVPGYEYHFVDESLDPPVLRSQIPPGYAGAPSDVDESRADASAWLERLPVVRQFRREVLGERRAGATAARRAPRRRALC